jgi:hypothetical protein
VHHRTLSASDLRQAPVPALWNLENVGNRRGHLDFPAISACHTGNAPNLRTQTRFPTNSMLFDSHIDKSLQRPLIHPPQSQSLTEGQ